MKIKIRDRWDSEKIIFSGDYGSLRECVVEAVKSRADLSGANLSRANLSGADLFGADLSGADLSRADLSGANLSMANLSGANLFGADLFGANLYRAKLSGADLSGANLFGADLFGANLYRAKLSGADLSGANLFGAELYGANLCRANLYGAGNANFQPFKTDLWDVLLRAKHEVAGLRQALIDGKVDGSTYKGECACLCGTIANLQKCDVESIPGLKTDSERPIEQFFLAIKPGDTPDKNQFAKLAVEWIDEFQELIKH